MPKWRLVISGRLQTSGYRVMVKNIAIGLQVKGIARNLDDGTVEIYCETSPEKFEQFRKAIDVKADPRNTFAPTVEKIVVYDEKSREFGKIPADFKGFKIDYSGIDPQLENLERSEMGIVALGAVSSNIIAMHTDLKDGFNHVEGAINSMHTDLKEGFKETKDGLAEVKNEMKTGFNKVESAVSSMHGDMNTRFDTLDTKYGEISTKMNDLTTELRKSTNALVAMTEKVGALIDRKLAE